jgi:hypothetical protein
MAKKRRSKSEPSKRAPLADALRGSMDAAEYKHVVLGLQLFQRLVGERPVLRPLSAMQRLRKSRLKPLPQMSRLNPLPQEGISGA